MTANPTACLLIIGNEVLSGRTRDANLQFIATRLGELGIPMREARVIPDVPETIISTVNEARARYTHVFTTGGIGPTHDDITSECVARAFGVPLRKGRSFAATDVLGQPYVAVVSETLAREYWPGEDAVGKRVRLSGEDAPITVVGVARDVRPEALSEAPKPTYYLLNTQFAAITGIADAGATFVLRTAGDPAALTNAARAVVRALDPELAVDEVQTLESVVRESVARPRFTAAVLGAFGLSALALAVVGVYGVLSHTLTQRRRELAVRLAIGARPGEVRRLVVQSGLRLATVGVALGLVAAAAGGRVLAALLYEVSPTDPTTLAAVAAVLLGAAAAASWFPARRATRVSPAEVLRAN